MSSKILESLKFDVNEELELNRSLRNWVVPQLNTLEDGYSLQFSQQQQQSLNDASQVSVNFDDQQKSFIEWQQFQQSNRDQPNPCMTWPQSSDEIQEPVQQNPCVVWSQSSNQILNDSLVHPVENSTENKKTTQDVVKLPLPNSKGKDLRLLEKPKELEMTTREKIEFVKLADFSKKIPKRSGSSMLEDSSDDDENEQNMDTSNDSKDDGKRNIENGGKNISKFRQCLICNRKYANASYFRSHCREIHNLCIESKRSQIMCTLCGNTFSSKESYYDHEQQTKSNLIYCLEKVQALRNSSKANSSKNFKNVSAIDLQLMSKKSKKIKLSE